MVMGIIAVSSVNHCFIAATYSTGMSSRVRRIVTLLVLISLVSAVALAALAGVVFAA